MNNLFFRNNCNNSDEVYLENFNRGENNPKEGKKSKFKDIKDNTLKSLNEVEYFLNNFKKFSNCIKLYKILK